MLFRRFGDVLNLAGPNDPPPQGPRRYLGDLKSRHVAAGLAVALLLVAGSWAVVVALGWGVLELVAGMFG